MSRHRILSSGAFLFAHIVHVVVLLMPTLAVAGLRGIGWTVAGFAAAISAAAVLESWSVTQPASVTDTAVHDVLAMRVALLVGIGLLLLFWVAQMERLAFLHDSRPLQLAGAASVFVGVLLRVMAMRALGAQFASDIQAGAPIVCEGIYAWLRHPSEIGLLLIAVGGPLLLGARFTAFAAVVLLLPISLWRTRRENVACFPSWPS